MGGKDSVAPVNLSPARAQPGNRYRPPALSKIDGFNPPAGRLPAPWSAERSLFSPARGYSIGEMGGKDYRSAGKPFSRPGTAREPLPPAGPIVNLKIEPTRRQTSSAGRTASATRAQRAYPQIHSFTPPLIQSLTKTRRQTSSAGRTPSATRAQRASPQIHSFTTPLIQSLTKTRRQTSSAGRTASGLPDQTRVKA